MINIILLNKFISQISSSVKGGGIVRKAWRTPPINPQESNSEDHRDLSVSRSNRSSPSSKHYTSDTSITSYHNKHQSTSRSNALLSNISKHQNQQQQQQYNYSNRNSEDSSSSNTDHQRRMNDSYTHPSNRINNSDDSTTTTNNTSNKSRNNMVSEEQQSNSIRSSSGSASTGRTKSAGLRLTGDPETDDDIMAFMRARQQLANKSKFFFQLYIF